MDASFNAESMRAEKREVAQRSVYAALLITGLKFVVGLTTGSLGILSEALHSALDLIAAVVTLLSVRVSDKPADADHQYGHGKVENFSAFIETALLLLTCIWIVWEAFKRLFFHSVEIEPSLWAFVVMFISIAVDAWRSRALKRVADRYDSQALQADALHFSTDIWSSSVVILGLAVVWAGREYHVAWLAKADPIAALFVACVVVYVSWRLARQTIDALLDAAPAGVRAQIIDAVESVPGVLEIDRVRIRRAGNRYFADLSVGLARTVTFQRSEQIVAEVTQRIRSILKDVDVLVNAVPRALHSENIFDRIRAAALNHNLMVHDVSVQDLGGQLHVEQHLELDENLSLLEAHDHVTALEADIRDAVPEISSILTHIESEPATIETSDEIVQDHGLEHSLKDIVAGFPDVVDVHEIVLKRVRDHLFLSCHVTMQDELPLSRVHDIQTALEIRFKQAAPQLFRVLIHPEPQTDNRR
ncbi:MAG TPA: cation-efflux pump [Terriglobales bacterium]|nr:cation-efflux pump [Terriglobales bacterium]